VRQQVNLYQPSAAAMVRQVLSASTVMVGGLLILTALAAISGYGAWEISRLAKGVDLVRQQHESQKSLLLSTNDDGVVQTPEEVEASNKALRAELDGHKRALDLLNAGAAGQRVGFSTRLEALARRHVEGLWLDRLVLGGDQAKMNLSGATLDADLVPRYLQNLATDPALNGTRFDEFVIEQPVKTEGQKAPAPGLRFRASNAALAATLPQEQDPS
jgi:hypothetical protein